MPDNKESKRNSKLPPGVAATINRLETSRAVQHSLKNVGDTQELSFLKDAAIFALAILTTVQGIKEGEIDETFAALALDSCGLVYITIDRCEQESAYDSDTMDRMKVDASELTKFLEEISEFVEKKAHRNMLKRLVKQSADSLKIVAYRHQLKEWMQKFAITTYSSIHDALEELIDRKVHRREEKKQTSSLIDEQLVPQAHVSIPLTLPLAPGTALPGQSDNKPPSRVTTPDSRPQKQMQNQGVLEEIESKDRQTIDAEAKGNKISEQEQARKQAAIERWRKLAQNVKQLPKLVVDGPGIELEENQSRRRGEIERWRKAAQEYDKLPEDVFGNLDNRVGDKQAEIKRWQKSAQEFNRLSQSAVENPDIRRASQASMKFFSSSAIIPLVVVDDSDSETEVESDRSRSVVSKVVKTPFLDDDARIAAALHAKIQKEFDQEDEEMAYRTAAKLQREWEAEERRNSPKARPKNNAERSQESMTAARHRTSLPPDVLKALMLEDCFDAQFQSPSPKPSSMEHLPHPTGTSGIPALPPGSHDPNNIGFSLPNPHVSFYPSMSSPPPVVDISHVSGSAVALGGGPVSVSNVNSGNSHHLTITNSMNDYSVKCFDSNQ